MNKEYRNNERILDARGNFIDNPSFAQQGKILHPAINVNDISYYSSIYFWSDRSSRPIQLQVIMDTGSSWLWVASNICQGCPSDDSLDHSFITDKGEGIKTIQYGSGGIKGDKVRTSVSLDQNRENALKDYLTIEVTSATLEQFKGSKWDGILGLLPSAISGSELFVTELYKAGIIADNAFGIYYTNTKDQSEITFGGYDHRRIPSIDKFSFVNLYSSNHWDASLNSIKMGDIDLGVGRATSAVLDSGSSYILFLGPTYDLFKEAVKGKDKARQCLTTKNGIYGCYCKSKYDFDPMYFWLDNYIYRVAPDNYVNERNLRSGKFCEFYVGVHNVYRSAIILGDSFLRNYYVYHDNTNKRMGFYGQYMVFEKAPHVSYDVFIFIGIAAFVVIVILICVVCFFVFKSDIMKEDQRKLLPANLKNWQSAPVHRRKYTSFLIL